MFAFAWHGLMLSWQVGPLKPDEQMHLNSFIWSIQVPFTIEIYYYLGLIIRKKIFCEKIKFSDIFQTIRKSVFHNNLINNLIKQFKKKKFLQLNVWDKWNLFILIFKYGPANIRIKNKTFFRVVFFVTPQKT